MEDEDDEETREWEMAQAQRAGGWKEEEPEKPVKGSYHPTPSEPSVFRRDDADLQCRLLAPCLR